MSLLIQRPNRQAHTLCDYHCVCSSATEEETTMASKRVLGFPIGIESAALIAVLIALINLSQSIFAEREPERPSSFEPFNVSYDHRALIIDGRRRMLVSAGIHYPRATPEVGIVVVVCHKRLDPCGVWIQLQALQQNIDCVVSEFSYKTASKRDSVRLVWKWILEWIVQEPMWPDLIAKSKEGGADVIQSYAFWNGHEPVRGQYNFEGNYDIVKFVKLVGAKGLYFHFRIGPYVCAEWNFGGFPVWLRDIPGIEFRTDNVPFKKEMQRFVKKMVDLMKQEMLFSWQGGPIILLQIENEYGNIEGSFGQRGKDYVKWAARMAVGLGAGVPWVMCRQTDAPENIIDACNGFYCDGFRPNSYKKPALWTEDWNGWYASWGGTVPHRPVQDNAFAVARFFQHGGSFQNYYMPIRTSGGPFYTTSYDYDAPIDEFGLLRQPKWGHLKDLHAAIKLCEPALVSVNNSPQYKRLGPKQEAHVYNGPEYLNSNQSRNEIACSAFLANIDERNTVSVTFRGRAYTLPPWSVSILPDCENVAFNTAKVSAQISVKSIEPGLSQPSDSVRSEELLLQNRDSSISVDWKTMKEPVGAWSESNFTVHGVLEHLNVTKDTSDYLWYITRVPLFQNCFKFVASLAQLLTFGRWVKVAQPVDLQLGDNELAILSGTVGLQNYGAFLEKDGAGFRGRIKLAGLKSGDIDLSASLWTYQVGLKGEFMNVYAPDQQESVNWVDLSSNSISSTLTWYQLPHSASYFDATDGIDPVALDFGSMGKGQAWVNGHNIGRFWSLVAPKDGCQETCDYRGAYNENKCAKNCGKLTQKWYHVPRSWLKSSDNLLVIFEETGGNPLGISMNLHYTRTICGSVSESDYPPLHRWIRQSFIHGRVSISGTTPEMQLRCDDGHVISDIVFASYGTPLGSCQHFSTGHCHTDSSVSVVSNIKRLVNCLWACHMRMRAAEPMDLHQYRLVWEGTTVLLRSRMRRLDLIRVDTLLKRWLLKQVAHCPQTQASFSYDGTGNRCSTYKLVVLPPLLYCCVCQIDSSSW
ncbi:hypothetical protein Sjap_002657 [Stephania japonica]|uniref:Beta-galactosidase n=1 Tax=Stephania japonica TaxID=461633 RepID=A0AAP0KPE6_9MAGN